MKIGNTTHGNGTSPAFYSWLRLASPGEVFVYHIGHLAADREAFMPTRGTFIAKEPLNTLARLVAQEAEAGYLTLAQARDGDHFQYTATRTRKEWK